jgi:hypothetical protein
VWGNLITNTLPTSGLSFHLQTVITQDSPLYVLGFHLIFYCLLGTYVHYSFSQDIACFFPNCSTSFLHEDRPSELIPGSGCSTFHRPYNQKWSNFAICVGGRSRGPVRFVPQRFIFHGTMVCNVANTRNFCNHFHKFSYFSEIQKHTFHSMPLYNE